MDTQAGNKSKSKTCKKSKAKSAFQTIFELRKNIKSGDLDKARSLLETLSPKEFRKVSSLSQKWRENPAKFDALSQTKRESIIFQLKECQADILKRLQDTNSPEFKRFDNIWSSEWSPEEFSVSVQEFSFVEFLRRTGGDGSILDKDRESIVFACETKQLSILQIFARQGADFNMSDDHGRTCLMKATDDVKICRFLLDWGVDINCKDNDGNTALHYAVKCIRTGRDTMRLILDKGADINCKNNDGETVLHCAVKCTPTDRNMVKLILDRGADINCKNNDKETVLQIAARLDQCDLVKLLLDRGADAFVKNNQGDDVLRMACALQQLDVIGTLKHGVSYDVYRQIECFQLFAVGLITSTFSLDAQALIIMGKAVELSVENNIEITPATLTTSFGILVEATSSSELEELSRDKSGLYMQAVVLTHKYLGPNRVEFLKCLRTIAKRCYDIQLFDRSLQLFIYCFRVTRDSTLDCTTKTSELDQLASECSRFVELCFKNRVKPCLRFDLVYEFMEAVVQEASKCTEDEEKDVFVNIIVTVIMLLFSSNCEDQQKLEFQKLVRFAVKTVRKYNCSETLLMNAFYFWKFNVPKYLPNSQPFDMLLDCGEDVNQTDEEWDNFGHLLCRHREDFGASQAKQIAAKLVKYGIHLDARNLEGVETAECLRDLGISCAPPINLMCIAARVIRKHNIYVKAVLPNILIDFVEMH